MVSFKMKLSYGLGALGKDYACAIVYIFLMYYFTDVLGLAPAFVGSLFLVARMWDAINDPAMGMIVDNTRTKWGKFRPWILIGTVLNALALIAMFFRPDGFEGKTLYVYISIVYILWGMTYTVMDIPFWSMIPALSSDKKEREEIAVVPRIFASLAWLTLGSFGLPVIAFLGKGNEGKGFTNLAIGIAIFFLITSILTVVNVKEQIISDKTSAKINLKDTFKLILKNDQLIVLIGTVLMFNLMAQLSGGVAIYYFKYVIKIENLFSVFVGFSGLAEMGSLFAFPLLSRTLGRKKVFFLACAFPVVGFTMLFISGALAPSNVMLVALSGIIAKIGSGLSLGISTVMLADVVDYGEYKFGSRNESVIFSVQTLLVKSASAISGWLIGMGLSMVGYVANVEQTADAILGIKYLMIMFPIILSILGYLIYKKYYKLNDEYYDEVLENLEEKRLATN
ncbi:melibiose:sodium transporter MelB [Cetobacterium sp. 8H]|uniref:melibiose:sodium transporter MelB n=1 Tax=Cetobacterium sp. 8H TaxID=2759681 RepID=UPI00163D17B9|nr:melibiose:sodium transporter MelB [Cetobacterium sp. 8H]MBC2851953.1 melibiose:sodium transporter MelB [Cetobacterium sp. 8H]